jgi:hypothetical protein
MGQKRKVESVSPLHFGKKWTYPKERWGGKGKKSLGELVKRGKNKVKIDKVKGRLFFVGGVFPVILSRRRREVNLGS